jgi:hypothetical protein
MQGSACLAPISGLGAVPVSASARGVLGPFLVTIWLAFVGSCDLCRFMVTCNLTQLSGKVVPFPKPIGNGVFQQLSSLQKRKNPNRMGPRFENYNNLSSYKAIIAS